MRKKMIILTVLAAILAGFVISEDAYAGGRNTDERRNVLILGNALRFSAAAQVAGAGGNPQDATQLLNAVAGFSPGS